jgi:lysine 6-dehydrogenase
MRMMVLGAGLMGRAAAWELAQHDEVEQVVLVDRAPGMLEEAGSFLAGAGVPEGRVDVQQADLAPGGPARLIMAGFDGVLSAVPYYLNAHLTSEAVAARASFCDLGGNSRVVDRQLALDAIARRQGVTVVPDCGLAPGLTNVLVASLLEEMPEAVSIRIRVGGLPEHPRPPLYYKRVFSPEGLVNEYVEPCRIVRGGRVTEVAPLTEPEQVHFPEPFGLLEARHTSGGSSTLPATYAGRLHDLDYKTLRYPGHYAVIDGMAALGLFSSEPLQVNGDRVIPRRLTEHLLAHGLEDDDTDVVLLEVTGRRTSGEILGIRLIDRYDPVTGMSAMMRTTALPAAVICRMVAAPTFPRRGAFAPERAVSPGPFLQSLEPYGMVFEPVKISTG